MKNFETFKLKVYTFIYRTTVTRAFVFLSIREGKDTEGKLIHSSFVYSPNVTIQIKDVFGQDVRVARVGDSLTLRFVIDDENSESFALGFNQTDHSWFSLFTLTAHFPHQN